MICRRIFRPHRIPMEFGVTVTRASWAEHLCPLRSASFLRPGVFKYSIGPRIRTRYQQSILIRLRWMRLAEEQSILRATYGFILEWRGTWITMGRYDSQRRATRSISYKSRFSHLITIRRQGTRIFTWWSMVRRSLGNFCRRTRRVDARIQ